MGVLYVHIRRIPLFNTYTIRSSIVDNITQQSYNTEIKDLATDLVAEMMDEHENDRTNAEDFIHDRLHEVIDGHQWIIYYYGNGKVLEFTDNYDAWSDCYSQEDLGAIVAEKGLEGAKTAMAYFAMYQDVSELLEQAFDDFEEDL